MRLAGELREVGDAADEQGTEEGRVVFKLMFDFACIQGILIGDGPDA